MKEQPPRIRLTQEEYSGILRARGITGEHPKTPKYLLLDVETLPAQALVFHLSEQRIAHDHLLSDVVIVCWSAKYLYEEEMLSDCMTPQEAVVRDDKRIMLSLWKLLEDAECLIGHNIDKFDVRMVNARFIYHGINPPTPYQTIDTLKASRKALGTLSHRLDYLGKYLLNKRKLKTSFDLWTNCCLGDQESLDYMLKYNKEDVVLLEEGYLRMMPWIKPHPNYAIYAEANVSCCVYCGGTELVETGMYVTSSNRYFTKRCTKCGGIMRERKSDMTPQERENLLISVAR